MIKAEIFSQGEEVVSGLVADTNAAWLSQQLIEKGYNVTRHTAVGDKMDDLIELMREISVRADICLCTGGLGPTVDDLTASAVSKAFDLPLIFDAEAMQHIQAYFNNRKRVMPESNRKQALLPQGSTRLDNHWGTAPGFALHYQNCWFAFMPGVPLEMRHMYQDTVLPILAQRFKTQPRRLVTLKTIGIGESDIQQRLQDLQLPDTVELSFCAGVEDVQTKLLFPQQCSEAKMQAFCQQAKNLIGDQVYAVNGFSKQYESIAEVVAELLANRSLSLAAIETISHGLLAAKCRDYACIKESRVIPHARLLQLGTEADDQVISLQDTAHAALENLHSELSADITILQYFDASDPALGDRNQSLEVMTMLATPDGMIERSFTIGGHRLRKQNQAALLGLDLIRRYLQGIL